jgi:hypothetical protein
MLREYYASKFGSGPVNDVSKTINPGFQQSAEKPKSLEQPGLLGSLDKDYEVVEITIKLLKKI